MKIGVLFKCYMIVLKALYCLIYLVQSLVTSILDEGTVNPLPFPATNVSFLPPYLYLFFFTMPVSPLLPCK